MSSKLKHLEELLYRGKITRRDFLARVSALGVAMSLSPTLLSTSARADTPKKGGRLRVGLDCGATTDSLDPATAPATNVNFICRQLYNYLVEVDHRSNGIPELAESWESSPDAVKWVFKIRRGVEFHNGKTLDAEDVIFSINHHRGEKAKSGAKGVVKSIKDIKADGKHTVVFTLEEGNADFPVLMSDYHLGILPADTTDFEKGIGTGPYSLVKWEPGVMCLTKRNPNYWKEGRAHFDEVENISISDKNARVTALKSGRIDYMSRLAPRVAALIENEPGIQVINLTGNYHRTFPMLTDIPPYDNNDVRLALKYAVKRGEMVKMTLSGYGAVGNDHPIGPKQRYFASELPQREYDPDKAKYHLKKAGLEGHTFKLHASEGAFPGGVDAAVLYKEHAAGAGIKIEVVQVPADGYWKLVWIKKPWCECYWGGRPTEDWMFSAVYAEGVTWNDTRWKHDRFNKLLKEARGELDEKKRREMYVEMQRIVRDEGGAVIPMLPNIVEAGTTKLRHGEIATDFQLDGFRLAERWWFA